MQATEKIWMNGELVDWDDARIHVGAHGLHYGSGVFEGIRCYDTPSGPGGLPAHRSHAPPAQLGAPDRHGAALLGRRAQGAPATSCSPRTGCASATSGRSPSTASASSASRRAGNPVETVIMSWPWGTYLGEEALRSGIRAKISTWQRIPANVVPHASKATGIYLNSMLAVNEAQRAGYDEAILLTPEGTVADGPGETIFVGQRRQDLDARSLDRDPARDHARLDHHDRPRPRLRGGRAQPDPLRPVPRRRGRSCAERPPR